MIIKGIVFSRINISDADQGTRQRVSLYFIDGSAPVGQILHDIFSDHLVSVRYFLFIQYALDTSMHRGRQPRQVFFGGVELIYRTSGMQGFNNLVLIITSQDETTVITVLFHEGA